MRAPQDIVDKLNALLMAEGSRLKGAPMLPLHENTVREAMDALNVLIDRIRRRGVARPHPGPVRACAGLRMRPVLCQRHSQ